VLADDQGRIATVDPQSERYQPNFGTLHRSSSSAARDEVVKTSSANQE